MKVIPASQDIKGDLKSVDLQQMEIKRKVPISDHGAGLISTIFSTQVGAAWKYAEQSSF